MKVAQYVDTTFREPAELSATLEAPPQACQCS